MNLQEIAFMKNLIMQSYRREISIYLINLIIIIATPGLCLFLTTKENVIGIVITFLIFVISLIRFVYAYEIDGQTTPWKTRNFRLNALRQHKEGTFEEMRSSPCFSEFFDL